MQPSQDTAKQVDGVCDRFESQWLADKRPRIEDYLSAVPSTLRAALFRGLLPVELELLRKAGKAPIEADYVKRFPADANLISEIFKAQTTEKAGASETSVSPSGARTASFHAPDLANAGATPAKIGRFKLLAVLGEGAFGRVYKAHDPKLDRHVAIKVSLQSALGSPEDVDRFLHEARAAATLHHPNICPVHEVGQDENGACYIVLAFVEGMTLSAFLRDRKEPVAAKQAALIVRKLALALGAAHAKGIVHRDLKPANIMVGRERKDVIIMDFGLARHRRNGDAQETREGVVMGTPAYMSPEQARGDVKAIGPASDIYGLGVILYEMLARKVPFSGSVMEVLGKVLHVEPEPPSTHRVGVDPQLEAICMKALAKAPTERFASMKALADAIEGFLKGMPSDSIQTKPKANEKTSESSAGFTQVFEALSAERKEERKALEKAVGKHSRNQLLVVVGAFALLGLLIVAGGGIMFFFRTPTTLVTINLPKIDSELLKDGTVKYFLNDVLLPFEKLNAPIELKVGKYIFEARRGETVLQRYVFVVERSPDGRKGTIGIEEEKPFVPAEKKTTPKKEPPSEWVSLFNGKDLTGWKNHPDEPGDWRVENGVLVGRGPKRNHLYTERGDYTDFHFFVEARINAPGNAGQVFRAQQFESGTPFCYEALINSSGSYQGNRTGSLYVMGGQVNPSRGSFIKEVLVPPDTWFTQEVIAQGNRIIIKVNDKVVTDYVDKIYNKGYLALQLWLMPTVVEFRQIKVKELPPKAEPKDAGFVPLFNGKDLTGWTTESGDAENWKVRDGALVATNGVGEDRLTWPSSPKHETWLLSEKSYGDCIVRFDFLAESPGVNSGFGLRAVPGEKPPAAKQGTFPFPTHLQVEIFGQGIIDGTSKLQTGTVLGLGSQVVLPSSPVGKQRPVGEWNQMEVEVRGQSIRVHLNGASMVDASLDDLIARGGRFPGLQRRAGRIGFQRLGGTVRFRNIRIKELTPPEGAGFVPMFNGKDLTGWQGLVPVNARKKMTPEQYQAAVKKANEAMQGHWTVKDGVLHYDGKNGNLQTIKDYGNFELYADWKIGPNGDGGIYLRGIPRCKSGTSIAKAIPRTSAPVVYSTT